MKKKAKITYSARKPMTNTVECRKNMEKKEKQDNFTVIIDWEKIRNKYNS